MDDPLVIAFRDWVDNSFNEPDAARSTPVLSMRIARGLVQDLALKLLPPDGRASRRASSPDLLFTSGEGTIPLGVEVRVWSRDRRNFANRVSDALAVAVQSRRVLPDAMNLALVVAIGPLKAADGTSDTEFIAPLRELLRRQDGVGFDRVFAGFVESHTRWISISKNGDFETLAYEDVVGDLRQILAEPQTNPDLRETDHSTRALLVADEWGSSLGGISTLNREMAIGLARNGFQVDMLLPTFQEDEAEQASRSGITLYRPSPVPGLSTGESLLLPATYPEGYAPDIIVGHGRILGPYAFAVQSNQFPDAKRIHVVHTDAERLEAVKAETSGQSRMMRASERRSLELELAESSDIVAGVGPLLTTTIRDQLRSSIASPETMSIVPEPRSWPRLPDLSDPPTSGQILVMGRTDDTYSKGLDIVARAIAVADSELIADHSRHASLQIRGVDPMREADIEERLKLLAGEGRVNLRPYSTLEAELRVDLFAASAVALPSRHEGFGLSAFEAMSAGVPVLVSESSGIAELLLEIDSTAPEVIPVNGSESYIIQAWSDAIVRVIENPIGAFTRAEWIRQQLVARHTWAQVAAEILSKL